MRDCAAEIEEPSKGEEFNQSVLCLDMLDGLEEAMIELAKWRLGVNLKVSRSRRKSEFL